MTLLLDAPEQTGEACKLDSCRFCGLNRGQGDLFVDMYNSQPELDIPGVPANLAVLMDSFPIAHGGAHLLITPRRHYPSLAQYLDQAQLRRAVDVTADILSGMFPDHWLFVFEHGPGAIDNRRVKCGGCHVDHAHGHVLVLDPEVDFDEIRDLTEQALADLGWDLALQGQQGETPFVDLADFTGAYPYLHLGRIRGQERTSFTYKQVTEEQKIPSQLLRRLVSVAAGKGQPLHWNWKIALEHKMHERLNQYKQDALGFKRALRDFLKAHVV